MRFANTFIDQRYYDPAIGRFLSVDPVAANTGAGFNRYDYANDNPYRFTDPDGRMSMEEAKYKSEQARARRERHEANERAAHTGLTSGGSRDNVRTGPAQGVTPLRSGVSQAATLVGGTSSLVDASTTALGKVAQGAADMAPELASSPGYAGIARDFGKVAKGAGIVSLAVDTWDMFAPDSTRGDRVHGAVGAVAWACGPEFGAGWAVVDFAASRAEYIPDRGPSIQGWNAVGAYVSDAAMLDHWPVY